MSAMPNIASVLKSETARVARKEAKTAIASLKTSAATHRAEIAALKKRLTELEVSLRRLNKGQTKIAKPTEAEGEAKQGRFSAKGLASQRKRLGLSANDVGLLVGSTGQSVYNWEAGTTRPRQSHMAAIAALRSLGKKSAAEKILQLRGQEN